MRRHLVALAARLKLDASAPVRSKAKVITPAGCREKHDVQHSGDLGIIQVITGVRRSHDPPEKNGAETDAVRWLE